jgi:hypothetical protein
MRSGLTIFEYAGEEQVEHLGHILKFIVVKLKLIPIMYNNSVRTAQ